MRYVLSVCIALICHVSEAQGIRFDKSSGWSELLNKAKSSDKFIFIDCYATWCGPCLMMERDTYPDSAVGKLFNEKFISVKLQMDSTDDDDQDVRSRRGFVEFIMDNYQIDALPTFLFFSPAGKLVNRELGYKEPEEFIGIGNKSISKFIK